TVPCVPQPGSAADLAATADPPRAGEGGPTMPDDPPSTPAASPSTPAGPPAAPANGPFRRLESLVGEHLRPTLKFLIVGGVVFGLDALTYNLPVVWHPAEGRGEGLRSEGRRGGT